LFFSPNLERNISPNYEANEIKLGRLLGPQLFRASENLVALGRSVREVGVLKVAIFQKVRFFGAT